MPASPRPPTASAITDLIGGLVLAAAQREDRVGLDPTVRAHLADAVDGLVPHPAER